MFMTAIPLSSVIGGPVSGWILDSMNGVLGVEGWRWLFLLEGLPSVRWAGLLRLPRRRAGARGRGSSRPSATR